MTNFRSIVLLFLFALAAAPLQAAETDAMHPQLESRFHASLGAFILEKELRISVNGRDPNDLVDFGERWRFGSSETSFAGEFRWRFGRKWSLWGQYFSSTDRSSATLTEDVQWGDYTFREGTFAGAGIGTDVARVFLGRAFSAGERHEFGIGIGAHWIELSAFVEGEARINDASTGFVRESVSAAAPLPNLGAWYYYALGPKWLASARLDWLDVSFDKYSGGLTNASVGIAYQAFDHLGVSLSYQYFGLDVDVKDTNWKGAVDIEYYGPFLSLTANW